MSYFLHGYVLQSGQAKTDPVKVHAFAYWPKPSSLKQLRQLLGFAYFNRRFIRDYSRLTKLTSSAAPFSWTVTFKELKIRFPSALVLIQPDPSRQFIVEVDASVGAALSQRASSRPAWWALFFGRFNLTLTYLAGSRNIKPSHDNTSPMKLPPSSPQSVRLGLGFGSAPSFSHPRYCPSLISTLQPSAVASFTPAPSISIPRFPGNKAF